MYACIAARAFRHAKRDMLLSEQFCIFVLMEIWLLTTETDCSRSLLVKAIPVHRLVKQATLGKFRSL